jgi:hypothetical protein
VLTSNEHSSDVQSVSGFSPRFSSLSVKEIMSVLVDISSLKLLYDGTGGTSEGRR